MAVARSDFGAIFLKLPIEVRSNLFRLVSLHGNSTASTGCSSIPFGATPRWPWM